MSTNGQVVATSEAYNSKAAAQGGIRAVKKLAADAVVEDQTTTEWAAAELVRKSGIGDQEDGEEGFRHPEEGLSRRTLGPGAQTPRFQRVRAEPVGAAGVARRRSDGRSAEAWAVLECAVRPILDIGLRPP